ncbi:MAG: mandelate racemase/muconate lactonizing enzyme family protein [Kiritimatiellae bacterium]|nr:mandelate racemase/muconate lactonizing enzyme family protein [Kiritimatiellia bacterium]
MKITKLETYAIPWVGLLKITTDTGATGWGQIATTDAADLVAAVLHRMLARGVLGRNPLTDLDAINQAALERNLKFPGSFVCRALAAVDTAIWDLRGKVEEKPVWALLGGTGAPVPVYGSSMSRKITPEEEAARMCRLRDRFGYRAFKLRLGSTAGHNRDAWEGRTETLIPTARKALGDEVTLHADANSCYTPDKAVEIGKRLEANNYGHFEEPCPYWEPDWTRQVTAKLTMPVAGGEQDNWMPVWKQMIHDHVVDIVQPDICYIGGVTRARRVAAMAAEHGMPCVPHSANHSLVTVFTLHLWNALPNHGPFMEFSIEDQTAARAMYEPALVPADGCVPIPDLGPGWGIRPKAAWLEKAAYQVSEAN